MSRCVLWFRRRTLLNLDLHVFFFEDCTSAWLNVLGGLLNNGDILVLGHKSSVNVLVLCG